MPKARDPNFASAAVFAFCFAFSHRASGTRWDELFSDAKTAEDRTQQIIRGVRSSDLAERLMRLAQLFGAELGRGGGRRREMRHRERKMLASRAERSQMALTREKGVVGIFFRADELQNRLAQQIDSGAGFRRQPDLGDTVGGAAAGLGARPAASVGAHPSPQTAGKAGRARR